MQTDPTQEHEQEEHEPEHVEEEAEEAPEHAEEEAEEAPEHEAPAAPMVPIALQRKNLLGQAGATMKAGQTYARPLTGGPARGMPGNASTSGVNVKRAAGKQQVNNASQRLGKRFGR
jgi:hypothetical protein